MLVLVIHFNEVSSVKESHDWQLGGGRGCQWGEDIEEETVFTDSLWTEDLFCGKATWHRLRTTGGICGCLKDTWPWKWRSKGLE